MILRRVIEHFKKQEWAAIFLDFIIVVMGVFIGIQLGNLNESRQDRVALKEARARTVSEARANLTYAAQGLDSVRAPIENFQHAIEDIRACREDGDARERINNALADLQLTMSFTYQNGAISQIATSERLLEQQSPEERALYADYLRVLNRANEWSAEVLEKMEMRSDDLHPFLDYGSLEERPRGRIMMSERNVILTVTPGEACRDDEFRKLLYRWETGHLYQLSLAKYFIDRTNEFLDALGEDARGEMQP